MVRIEFETDNASFRFDNGNLNVEEVGAIINSIGDRIANGGSWHGTVMDSSGNTVGKYVVE